MAESEAIFKKAGLDSQPAFESLFKTAPLVEQLKPAPMVLPA